ncbi:MAG: Gfo/Idh/MocA family oxidoreductase, partial [Clostridia bacterium]|nr:Gfo/Idh/MocA family oxidoreductase [Clostridia bacterium]
KTKKVCADFATFHKTRKKPIREIETYSGKILKNSDYEEVAIGTEDYASVLIHFDKNAHGSLTVNQTASGRKNRIYFEIYGSQKSVSWSGERPNELWIGNRDQANQIMLKDPALVSEDVRGYIGFPGGHNEGFADTSKQLFTQYYKYILNNGHKNNISPAFPTFEAGLRELMICERIVRSAKEMCWVEV